MATMRWRGCPTGLHMAVPSMWPPLANWDIHQEAPGAAGWVGRTPVWSCFEEFLNIGKCESGPKVSISSAQYPPSEVCRSRMQMLQVPQPKGVWARVVGWAQMGTPHFLCSQYIAGKKSFPPAARTNVLQGP